MKKTCFGENKLVPLLNKMKKFDLEDVRYRTHMQKDRLESYEKFFTDLEKIKRIAEQECVLCYYNSKIGGAAMTNSDCGLCEKAMMFGSTNVDKLCADCAKNHDLCKHCGADINLKKRNKL